MSYLFNQTTDNTRTGKQNRVNLDRFFHIMNEGWFVYVRKNTRFTINEASDSIAGPFNKKTDASEFLNQHLETCGVSLKQPSTEDTQPNNEENWRY